MRGMNWRLGAVVAALGLLVAGLAVMGANKSSCVPIEPEGCTSDDACGAGMYCDAGECATLGYCDVADDCYGQPIITPACVGYFTCERNACAWHCGPLPTQGEDCRATDVCAEGLTCVHYFGIAGPSGPEFATCEIPCSNDHDCPTAQQCVTIADGPGTVCVARSEPTTCAEWFALYTRVTTDLRACTTAATCEAVPGTSCGCTRNLVVNGANDLAPLWDVIDGMNAAGCGLVSTCDCPAADGYQCVNGLCGWNYVR